MKALRLRTPFKKSKGPDTSSQLSSQFSGTQPRSGETREQIGEGPKVKVDSLVYPIDHKPTNCSLPSDDPGLTASPENSSIDRIGEKDSYGIKVLHSPPSAVLDVVFVHGLTGSAYSTWLHKGSGKHWPRDLIKNDIKDARIMTFGYDADVAHLWGQAAQDGIFGYANDLLGKLARKRKSVERRKIIFVAHSLGGLVTQRALTLSRDSRFHHLQAIEASTVGICFLGTPHHGADLAKWGAILTDIVNIAKPANASPVRFLERDSEMLRVAQDGFHNVLEKRKDEVAKIGITCFYETLPLVRFLVVPKESAVISGELNYPMRANHIDMTKFRDRAAPGYEDVVGEIRRLANEGRVRFTAPNPGLRSSEVERSKICVPALENDLQNKPPGLSNEQLQPRYYIPFQRNKRFVSRNEELQAVRDKLFVKGTCSKVAIVGLGGVGKTQVALELAYQIKEKHSQCSIFWVPAVSAESFEQAFFQIALLLQIPDLENPKTDIKQSVKQALSLESTGQWLLIVDNADDADMFMSNSEATALADYIPESTLGSIVYTTRSQDVALSLADNDIVPMEEMGPTTGRELLGTLLLRKDLLKEDRMLGELLEELAFLPLAIAQAAAYLNRNKISISTYLELLRNTEEDRIAVLSREFEDKTRYKGSRNAVAATWIISFNRIKASDEDAANYLAFMSCIEPRMIPQSMLPPLHPKERMVHAIGTLCAYSFVAEREEGHSYDLHRLVHLAMKIWLREQRIASEWVTRAIQHLAHIFPNGKYIDRAIWREYLPHAYRILDTDITEESEYCCELYKRIGNCLREDGRYHDAEKWFAKAYTLNKAKYGTDDDAALECAYYLGDICQRNGKAKAAVQLLEHVVQVNGKLAEDHPSRLASQQVLAIAYRNNNQVKEAIQLLELVVQVRERVLAEDHPLLLSSQHALAITYHIKWQAKEAMELLERVVRVRKRTLAEDDPGRLLSQQNLAKVYRANGQVKEATQLLEHVVQVRERTLAEDHPHRLSSQRNLAIAYRLNGQVKEAVQLLERVVRVGENLAEDDPGRLASQHSLAIAYELNGQLNEAIKLFEHVVRVRERILPEDDSVRLASQQELARVYETSGQVKKAVQLLE